MRYFTVGYHLQDENGGHNDDWSPGQDDHRLVYLSFPEMPSEKEITRELKKEHNWNWPWITSITEWTEEDWNKLQE